MIWWQISHSLATRAENVSGDWHDLWECVNLASTRWINAIIGQTWRGENPFKARKAKQGPWLIHLANLRVMYECQGTLVRRGREANVCWLSGLFSAHVTMPPGWGEVSLRPGPPRPPHPPPLCRLSGQNKWSLDGEMTKRCTEGTEWVGKRDCFANEVGKRGCGLLACRVSTSMLCSTKSSVRSFGILKVKRLRLLQHIHDITVHLRADLPVSMHHEVSTLNAVSGEASGLKKQAA